MRIEKFLKDLSDEFPEEIKGLKSVVIELNKEMEKITKELSKKISETAESLNFEKVEMYLNLSKTSKYFEEKISEIIEVIDNNKEISKHSINCNYEHTRNHLRTSNKVPKSKYDLLISDLNTLKLEDNFTGKKPKSFILFDEKYIIKTWKDFLVKVYEILYYKNPDLFRKYVDNLNDSNDKKRIKEDTKGFISPCSIADKYYTETNLDSNTIKRLIRKIFEYYLIDEEELIVVIN